MIDNLDSYTFSNITANHTIKAVFKENPTITIRKDSVNEFPSVFGNGYYSFKITGVTRTGESLEYTKTLQEGQSVTFHIPVGVYKVTEITSQRTSLLRVDATVNGDAEGNTNTELGSASFTFVNKFDDYKSDGHNDQIVNILK